MLKGKSRKLGAKNGIGKVPVETREVNVYLTKDNFKKV